MSYKYIYNPFTRTLDIVNDSSGYTGDLLDSNNIKIATVESGLITSIVFTGVTTTDQGLYKNFIINDGLNVLEY